MYQSISIPLRYNLEVKDQYKRLKSFAISIPLRYNLEPRPIILIEYKTSNFNSTKVQFGDPFAIRYSKANNISIPLRYNLERLPPRSDC